MSQAAAAKNYITSKRVRKSFGKIAEVTRMPNLIEVQRSSYEKFLQMDVAAADRQKVGLEEDFKSVFPDPRFRRSRRTRFRAL